MKLNATFLMVMFMALSGFTWGSEGEKSASNTATTAASSVTKSAQKKAASSVSNSYNSASSAKPSYTSTSSGSQRANAVRILTSGDPATRKARMESITRLAKSMAAAKQAQALETEKNIPTKKSYQY